MRRATRFWSMTAAVLVAMVAFPQVGLAGDGPQPTVVYPVKHGASQALRDQPAISPSKPVPQEVIEINPRNSRLPANVMDAREPSEPRDMAVQDFPFENNMPDPLVNFEGNDNLFGIYPPDTTGDVGPSHYVQWVNLHFSIYDKTGTLLGGPFDGNSLWSGFGGSCEAFNSGDPIVLYDHIADRWFMSQFTGDNHQCIAVSKTGDPLGQWWLYDYLADADSGYFPDYPKFGVWPDGYYYSANMFTGSFQGAMAGVFERDAMLNGDPAQFIWFFAPDTDPQPSFSPLPADLDGLTLPGEGAPNPFVMMVDDAWLYDPPFDTDALVLMEFSVDWETPGNSTYNVAEVIDLATIGLGFDSNMCGYARSCIPQPDTSQGLDSISSRFMYRPQYRNFGDYETLLVSHTVDENSADHAGVRWYELRSDAGVWDVYQGSTFAPDDDHRWMGDLAMDASGNIAVGYSVASSTVYPSIRWAGRLVGDPLDTLAQGEAEVFTGSGSQLGTAGRWGDYSTMAVDPVDDCTFWYTQEYIETTGGAPWQTRIASFKFDTCISEPSGTIEGVVTNAETDDPLEGALVEVNGFSTVTNDMGEYSITVPADTYDVTASKFGFSTETVSEVLVEDMAVVTVDLALTPTAEAGLDGYVTGQFYGWPLYALVEIYSGGEMVVSTYTDPFNGYYEFILPIVTPYDIEVTPMIEGYDPAGRFIVLDPAGQTESFMLTDNQTGPWAMCGFVNGVSEDFEGPLFPPAQWTNVNNGGDCVWESTATTGRPNFTPGSGIAADADADWCGPGSSMDTMLYTPMIDLSAATSATLSFDYHYRDLGTADFGAVDISADGGASWANLFTWSSGTITGSESVDISSVAGSPMVQVRFSYFAPGWDWYFLVDNVEITSDAGEPGFDCTYTPGALVEGFVTDANSGDGLVGAEVGNDLGGMTFTMATPDDLALGDAFYYLFTPMPLDTGDEEGPSTRTFYAAADGYGTAAVDVNLTPSTVNNIDFDLEAGWLELVPDFLESRLYTGMTEDRDMEVFNFGGLDAEVSLRATEIPVTWDYSAPQFDLDDLPGNTEPLSMGRAPTLNVGSPSAPASIPNLPLGGAVEAYGVEIFPGDNLVTWPDIMVPGAWTLVGAGGYEAFYAGGDFLLGDFSQLYAINWGNNAFDAIDTASGAVTSIATAPPNSGEAWSGMTAGVDGTLYVSSAACGANSTLYTLDPGSGALSEIGSIGSGTCIIDIAINAMGEMYGVDIVSDALYSIDPGTGAGTPVGSLGADANFAQGMDFDEVSGTLYWAAYTGQGELRVIDTSTGASSLVGAFPGGAEVDSFAVKTSAAGGSLPWLVLDPEAGVAPADGSFALNAEFIADGAPHFGLYRATVSVSHDTPYDVNDADVCFTKAFDDVTDGYWADESIHSVAGARVSDGCGLGDFCPREDMFRHVMARWLLKLAHGPDYSPPSCVGIFEDVICESTPNADWIEQLYNEGITTGCQQDPLRYCPYGSVSRAEMSVFILRTLEGADYEAPPCEGIFDDVNCPAYWAVDSIEEIYRRGITTGCSTEPLLFCPRGITSRAQEATFAQRAWELPMCEGEVMIRE